MAISTGTALLAGAGLSAGTSLLKGFMGGGDNSGAATSASNQAFLANQHQGIVNRSDASPWTSAGREAVGELGGLLGWGSLTNPGVNASLWTFGGDPTGTQRASSTAKYNLFTNQMYGDRPQVSMTFQEDPGYAWRTSEGNKALDRSASAKGAMYSGGQMKALTNYNQNAASNEYGNWWTRANQDYGNRVQQANNYINLLSGISGQGANMQSGVNSANSGLTQGGGSMLMAGGNAASAGAQNANNQMWNGITSAGNNLLTAGLYYGMGSGGDGFDYASKTTPAAQNAWSRAMKEGYWV
jgi:hypothetical protein